VAIVLSPQLQEILNAIQIESIIAQLILNDCVSDRINYIDLDVEEKLMLSYLPMRSATGTASLEPWTDPRRQRASIGKVVHTLIAREYRSYVTDAEVERFVKLLYASPFVMPNELLNFHIVDGPDIAFWYHEDQYAPRQGSLSASCMRYSRCQPFFRLYTDNPEVVRLLILTDSHDRLFGRALIWETSHGTFMDRVYGRATIQQRFIAFARTRDWAYRASENARDRTTWVVNRERTTIKAHVKLRRWRFSTYPFLDTFAYMGDDGFLFNFPSSHASYRLTSVEGELIDLCQDGMRVDDLPLDDEP